MVSNCYTRAGINPTLTLYYLKPAVDKLTSNYYTTTQSDTSLTLKYLNTEIDALVSNYYTTTESDTNSYNKSYINTLISG